MSAVRDLSTTSDINTPASRKRRAHRKSRAGCEECRRRRIKCDETKPSCIACMRHAISCVYQSGSTPSAQTNISHQRVRSPLGLPSRAPIANRFSTSAPSQTDATEPHTAARAATSSAVFTSDDMALLHNWDRITSLSIVGSPQANVVWQDVIPRIGIRHAFVMHAILSLSALHLAYLYQDYRDERLLDATRHHSKALQGFQDRINNMTEADGDALFACASLNVAYVFGIHGRLSDGLESSLRSAVRQSQILGANLLPIVRGVGSILLPMYERIQSGPLAPLLSIGNWDMLDIDCNPPPEDQHLRDLRTAWAQDAGIEVYDHALLDLRRCCAFIKQSGNTANGSSIAASYNGPWAGPQIWLHLLPDEYFLRLDQRQPAALLIYCYCGALMHDLEGHWLMEGWSRNIVGVVDELLGHYWAGWLQWPKSVVGLA